MFYIFEVIDKKSKLVYLTKERWSHIIKEHPIINNKIEDIKETLKNPLAIREGTRDHNTLLYYKYYKNIKQKKKYLLVIVKYLNGKGFIVTSFYINKIKGLK